MFTQTIEYEDYNGNKCKEDFYFYLNKAELIRLQATYPGGFGEHLQRIIDAADTRGVYEEFEKFIGLSYGVRSDDGKRFMKKAPDGHRYVDDFMETEAYSELIEMLLSDAEFAAKFVQGIMPAALMKEFEESGGVDRLRQEMGLVEGGKADAKA